RMRSNLATSYAILLILTSSDKPSLLWSKEAPYHSAFGFSVLMMPYFGESSVRYWPLYPFWGLHLFLFPQPSMRLPKGIILQPLGCWYMVSLWSSTLITSFA